MNGNALIDAATIQDWGLGELSPQEQQHAVEKLGQLLYHSLLDRSLDMLDEAKQQELSALMDKPESDIAAVLEYLRATIPTFGQIVSEEQEKLREEVAKPLQG